MNEKDALYMVHEYAKRVNASHCGYLGLMLIHDGVCHGPRIMSSEYPEQLYETSQRRQKRIKTDAIQYDKNGRMILTRVKEEAQRGWTYKCNQRACTCAACSSSKQSVTSMFEK